MRDSLALEAAFLRREEELLKYWWTEYAECSDGPSGYLKHTASFNHLTSTSSKANQETGHGTIDEERVGVPVKGGLYEVMFLHIFLHVKIIQSSHSVMLCNYYASRGALNWTSCIITPFCGGIIYYDYHT